MCIITGDKIASIAFVCISRLEYAKSKGKIYLIRLRGSGDGKRGLGVF